MHVSDHALVRYLERVVGLNLDAYREAIKATVRASSVAGACSSAVAVKINIPQTRLLLVVKDNTIVTIIDKKVIDYRPPKHGKQWLKTNPKPLKEIIK